MNIFSDEVRRNPYPVYDQMRAACPALYVPAPFDGWLLFDYESVKRALNDHETFSSQVPAPKHWFVFLDPPVHSKLRALVSKAFTPRMIANLEPAILKLTRELLMPLNGEVDFANEFAVPLPMKVIGGMIGIPTSDWQRFKRWSDTIMRLSYSRSGGAEAEQSLQDFRTVTVEMNGYLGEMIAERRATPKDDLLTRLIEAEVDGERLSQEEILGFFQLLVVAGQETTTNLLNNALLCFLEHPEELDRVRNAPQLLPSAIEEVLRYCAPLQWVMRAPRRDVLVNGQTIPAGKLTLTVIGSANRDPKVFPEPNRFNVTREPNPHLAFGHGIHSCLGAALARMEARIALREFLDNVAHFEMASAEPWEPRKALHVLGPTRLPLLITKKS
jgi:cytochrome P450